MTAGRPRLVDLFCGPGGAAMGYWRAGFDVTGVDEDDQPNYPFPFVRADAMTFPLDGFDAAHASPPCQGYSVMASMTGRTQPRLIPAVRERLTLAGLPFVIENVEGADLEPPSVILCGTMFGLKVRRHRVFEVRPATLILTPDCACRNGVKTGRLVGHRTGGRVRDGRTRPPRFTEVDRREAIGCNWMTAREARQAVPPAFTELIGRCLLRVLEAARA
jgi:DNA (cytosine-5)-methyltransferase 1